MKNTILIIALMFSFGVFAQDIAPKFEKDGEMVKATYFHENGEVAQVGHFLNQKLEGEWKMYNEAGKKIAMGSYINGVKTGKWFFWEGNGLKEVDFYDNEIANVIQWNNSEAVVLNK